MTRSTSVNVDNPVDAAMNLGRHPQDHGWRNLYQLFAYGLRSGAPELTDIVKEFRQCRPDDSYTHLITLLGIAVKMVSVDLVSTIKLGRPDDTGLARLESVLRANRCRISMTMRHRHNSFTGARRFLVPQVLLSAYFGTGVTMEARFADLGTGLGVMPRQLNAPSLFECFGRDLIWAFGQPQFRPIPLSARFGVDQGPMPDLDWVRTCYGSSAYYSALYEELLATLRAPEVEAADVRYAEIDIADTEALRSFITTQDINAVNLSYVLYELRPQVREKVLELILDCLRPPKFVIIIEPNAELGDRGCVVSVCDEVNTSPVEILAVSDGHFCGHVTTLDSFQCFVRHHPIGV